MAAGHIARWDVGRTVFAPEGGVGVVEPVGRGLEERGLVVEWVAGCGEDGG